MADAKATFELSPSMFAAFGGAVLFFLAVIAAILAMN